MAQLAQNVIPFRKPTGIIGENSLLADVHAYWDELRGDHVAPNRADFDPVRIHAALKHTFILSARDHTNIRFRIVGHALMQRFGMALHGMPATSLIAPPDRTRFMGMLSRMIYDPRVIEISLSAQTPMADQPPIGLLMLPLQDRADGAHQLLGVLQAPENMGAAPHRLRILNAVHTPIRAARPLRQQLRDVAEPRAIYRIHSDTPH